MQLHIIMMTDITVMLQLASKCQRTDMLREARIFNYFCKGLPYICINGMEAVAHIDLVLRVCTQPCCVSGVVPISQVAAHRLIRASGRAGTPGLPDPWGLSSAWSQCWLWPGGSSARLECVLWNTGAAGRKGRRQPAAVSMGFVSTGNP